VKKGERGWEAGWLVTCSCSWTREAWSHRIDEPTNPDDVQEPRGRFGHRYRS